MKKFVDRQEEMEFLSAEYSRPGSSLVILYGRRRVGKTELSNEFIRDKKALYFLVTEESEIQNRNSFKDAVADFCNNDLLRLSQIDQWEIIFKTLLSKTDGKKLILVIDEFQYLGKSNTAFPSIFQKIWDTILRDANIMVILCGSLVSMMESQTLHYSSPLFGRRTGQIKLKQIRFSHYHEFFPNKTRKELIEYYSVTGGVPKYIELFSDDVDIYSAIKTNILARQSYLYDEPNFLLQQEVSEIGSYFSIIRTIASGNQKLGKIATALEVKQTGLSKYLKTLIDLDILERQVPITEENPEKSKRGLYRIKDNFILFWFKFVYPNMRFIESGNLDFVAEKIRINLNDSHISHVYEEICLEEIWKFNTDKSWSFIFDRAGRWWSGDNEIDIVAYDSNGEDIIFGECKYWEGKVGANILTALEAKAKAVEWKKEQRNEHYILFSINGFTDELKEIAKNRTDVMLAE